MVGAPVLGVGAPGFGAVVLAGIAELGGCAVVVVVREVSRLAALPLGDGDPVCDVGVHATIAATTREAAAARRRGCGRYISQLLRNGEVRHTATWPTFRVAQNVVPARTAGPGAPGYA